MPAKSKKQKPEDMLLRVIRVADILAHGEDDSATVTEDDQQGQPVELVKEASPTRQKTQAQRFNVS